MQRTIIRGISTVNNALSSSNVLSAQLLLKSNVPINGANGVKTNKQVAPTESYFDRSIPPYARVQSRGPLLVSQVAQRASNRIRNSLADISLDKETSIITGVLTPGRIASMEEKNVSRGAQKKNVQVTVDALGRIQRAFGNSSATTKAVVDAVLNKKAAEIESESRDVLVAKLSDLALAAIESGVNLKLTKSEREAITEYRSNLPYSLPRLQASPVDPVATKMKPLSKDAAQLASYLQNHRHTVLEKARGIRFGLLQQRRQEIASNKK